MPIQERFRLPRTIADLHPAFRERDGVVFDTDSYARHFPPAAAPDASPASAQPTGAFLSDPLPVGWRPGTPGYPIMGGRMTPPQGGVPGFSSGSGSGSGSQGGGYGLELI